MTQPTHQASTGGRLGISGAIEYRDADGNVLKIVHLTGSIPLADLGLTEQQAADLVAQQKE